MIFDENSVAPLPNGRIGQAVTIGGVFTVFREIGGAFFGGVTGKPWFSRCECKNCGAQMQGECEYCGTKTAPQR